MVSYQEKQWCDKEPANSPVQPEQPWLFPNHHFNIFDEFISSIYPGHSYHFANCIYKKTPTGGIMIDQYKPVDAALDRKVIKIST